MRPRTYPSLCTCRSRQGRAARPRRGAPTVVVRKREATGSCAHASDRLGGIGPWSEDANLLEGETLGSVHRMEIEGRDSISFVRHAVAPPELLRSTVTLRSFLTPLIAASSDGSALLLAWRLTDDLVEVDAAEMTEIRRRHLEVPGFKPLWAGRRLWTARDREDSGHDRERGTMNSAARMPEMYKCGGCGRALLVEGVGGYEMPSGPPADTPEDRISRIVDPRTPGFTLLCTCGHWTVVDPRSRHRTGDSLPP